MSGKSRKIVDAKPSRVWIREPYPGTAELCIMRSGSISVEAVRLSTEALRNIALESTRICLSAPRRIDLGTI
jgi:hypothetical protein